MLTINPIEEKQEQERLCAICGIPYRIACLAYGAYVDGNFVGMSQFTLCDDYGILCDLAYAEGTHDREAMFILGRQTMNWIDLLGIHECRTTPTAGEAKLLRLMGFVPTADPDVLVADMRGMFDGHCGGNCNLAKELLSDDE